MTTAVPALDVPPVDDLLRRIISATGLDLQFEITHKPGATPELAVEFTGPDIALLIERNGELLHAFEHITAKVLRLEAEEHDRISFDAGYFKAERDRNLMQQAEAAVARVRSTGQPFAFDVMTSRERRMLHLALKESGLPTASSGDGPRRFVVLYPEDHVPPPPPVSVIPDRARQIRNTFRRRDR